MPRILISYLVHRSGHHAAALAIEEALHQIDPSVNTLCVDLLAYTHPRWAAIIQRTYMTTIRRTPELWDALYDSHLIEHRTRRIRTLIQRGRSKPLLALMDDFHPDAAVCTQAHPFAVLNAYAGRQKNTLPIWGVITDFIPHRFWVVPGTAWYVVPHQSAADRLVWLGVDRERIFVLGIPIQPRLSVPDETALLPGGERRRVLVMGGSRGLGIGFRTVWELDRADEPFTIDVVTGSNIRLRRQLLRNRDRFRHPIRIRGYVRDASALMRRATLLISKPGGLTSAEAMAVGLPMVVVRALPGQEKGNADYLVRHGAAVPLGHERDVAVVVATLLAKSTLTQMMRERAMALSRPAAAVDIAREVLARLPAA